MRLALTLATALSLSFPALVLALDGATPREPSTASITISVEGLRSAAGAVQIGLYADEAGWSGGNPVATTRVEPVGNLVQAVFEDLESGDYAVRLYHDVDGDGDLSMNVIGIPNEPFGYSNDPRPRFRGARFDEAAFDLAPEASITMSIQLTGAGL